jgi:hypothetical protein
MQLNYLSKMTKGCKFCSFWPLFPPPSKVCMFDVTNLFFLLVTSNITIYTWHVWCLHNVSAYNIMIYISYCKCYVVCNQSHLLDLNHCSAKWVGMKVGKCIKILTIYPFIIYILSRTTKNQHEEN